MKTATLIVNPASGRARRLAAQMPAIEALLQTHGYTHHLVETTPDRTSAKDLAVTAAARSSLVIACGGDGTVHGVIQGLAHTGTTLGVLPLGTANALARNLRLPLDPLAAMTRLLTYAPQLIPLGEIVTATQRRFFAVMAGCGPDGALIHALSQPGIARIKARFGRHVYYGHALRLFLTRRWPSFEVAWREPGSTAWQNTSAVALMASRVPDLGGIFTGLTSQASLPAPSLHVKLLRAPAQLSLPAWFVLRGLANPWLTTVDVEELRCTPSSAAPVYKPIYAKPIYSQADAEPMGSLPFSLHIVPAALSLLMPRL